MKKLLALLAALFFMFAVACEDDEKDPKKEDPICEKVAADCPFGEALDKTACECYIPEYSITTTPVRFVNFPTIDTWEGVPCVPGEWYSPGDPQHNPFCVSMDFTAPFSEQLILTTLEEADDTIYLYLFNKNPLDYLLGFEEVSQILSAIVVQNKGSIVDGETDGVFFSDQDFDPGEYWLFGWVDAGGDSDGVLPGDGDYLGWSNGDSPSRLRLWETTDAEAGNVLGYWLEIDSLEVSATTKVKAPLDFVKLYGDLVGPIMEDLDI